MLNNPAMHGHALFGFRDPAFLAAVPARRKPDLEAESPEVVRRYPEVVARAGYRIVTGPPPRKPG